MKNTSIPPRRFDPLLTGMRCPLAHAPSVPDRRRPATLPSETAPAPPRLGLLPMLGLAYPWSRLGTVVALGLVSFGLFAAQASAQEIIRLQPQSPLNLPEFIPPDKGQPDDSAAGGSRQPPLACLDTPVNNAVMALMPQLNDQLVQWTTRDRPSFFAYLPAGATKAVFSLRDESETYFHYEERTLQDQAGIAEFELPNHLPALSVNHNYTWTMVVSCDATITPDDPQWRGQIRRVSLDAVATDASPPPLNANSIDLAFWYGRHGVWLDALEEMAHLRQAQPLDPSVGQTWQHFLQSAGLESISMQPFIEAPEH